MTPVQTTNARLDRVVLDEDAHATLSPFIEADREQAVAAIGLVLGPFRRLMKDYQLLVDSHIKAVEEGREARIQAIDMGRRGLHNEGAELMHRRLAGKIDIDFETARRLFTLVCVLHQKVSAR